jgi:NAD(P)-dependent dehydrogenase (short-subunit alcohol dehydrogenase family)
VKGRRRRPAALVTGAARGIGREIALCLARRGVRVGVGFHASGTAASRLAARLPGRGHAAIGADISDPAAARAMWEEARDRLGRIDILVNNAAVYFDHPPLSSSPEAWLAAWQATLAANLVGPAVLSQLAARDMARSGGGRIVNLSSRGAFRGEPDAPAYGASKAALNSLGQSMARGLAPKGVLVFCVAPGWVDTDMAAESLTGPKGPEIRAQHPLGRVATAAEIAGTAAYCALDAPAVLTGCIIDANGASYLRT